MKTLLKFSKSAKNQSGATLVFVAIMIVVFLGVAALAIDIGYQRVVRNELQNAADAAALAACNRFYRDESGLGIAILASPPNWSEAVNEADQTVKLNKSANQLLSDIMSKVGWWDITTNQSDQWYTIDPNDSSTNPPYSPLGSPPYPSENQGPAIEVRIIKTEGQNNGPISNFFAGILNSYKSDVSATATAVAASPGSVRPGAVIPFAYNKTVIDNHYRDHLISANDPTLIFVGSTYHYPEDIAGQWTALLDPENSRTASEELLASGNPTALTIGDEIWIQTGTMDNLYDHPNQASIDSLYTNKDVVIPIVDPEGSTLSSLTDATGGWLPIVGFIGFHITCAGSGCAGEKVWTFIDVVDENGDVVRREKIPVLDKKDQQVEIKNSDKFIGGYFTTAPVYGGGPIGPNYGPADRCRLCR